MVKARIAGAAALGALAWAGYSWLQMNKPVPPDEEIRAYMEGLFEKMGTGEYLDTWREEVLEADGRRLRLYFFESDPSDPVLVFIPGTSVYALLYTEFMCRLSRKGFNVIGFDPRGHGKSSGGRGSYDLGELVEDARAVIEHAAGLYGERIAVGGSSQGGMAAFYAAAAEPRLKAAVCHNVIAPDEPDDYRMTRWPGLYRRLITLLPVLEPLTETPIGELRTPVSAYLDLKAETSRLFPDVGRFLKEDPLVVSAVSLRALVSLPATPLARGVEKIETPVMVIHSGGDNIFPEDYVRRVFGRLNCEKEFLYLPDRSHLVMIDFVDEIIEPVSGWLMRMMGS